LTTGTVTWADAGKGYGFIAPDGCENELFVSRSDMAAGAHALQVGARVEFDKRRGGHGRTAATNVDVRAASQIRSVEESAESDAENEGMPPKPESPFRRRSAAFEEPLAARRRAREIPLTDPSRTAPELRRPLAPEDPKPVAKTNIRRNRRRRFHESATAW
jgi:cold shock protein